MTCAVAALLADFAAAAPAPAYPGKAIRLVVPFAPGGSNDIMARFVAQQFTESMKQQVVVDNRAGASGIIGTDIVAKAPPDGYTILMMSLTFAVNPSLYSKLPYHTDKDFTAVTLVASAPLMLVVNPSVPCEIGKRLDRLRQIESRQAQLRVGRPGYHPAPRRRDAEDDGRRADDTHTLQGRWSRARRSHGRPDTAHAGEHPSTLPFAKSGKLRALAVSALKRSPLVPELPTVDETGLKGYEIVGWNGLFVPAGTPRAITTRLHSETVQALANPVVKERLAALGADPVGNTPEQFAAFVQAEIAKWAKVVKAAGLKVE
jgi:tripartite-type tricarboxylate transporter receptor subunit TctC